MTREKISRCLEDLGRRLEEEAIEVEADIVGGAVMITVHGVERDTSDIDIAYRRIKGDRTRLEELILEISTANKVPKDWLNDKVTAVMPETKDARAAEGGTLRYGRNLTLHHPSVDRLLGMKLKAGRRKDLPDLPVLIEATNTNTMQEARDALEKAFPGATMKERAVEWLTEHLAERRGRGLRMAAEYEEQRRARLAKEKTAPERGKTPALKPGNPDKMRIGGNPDAANVQRPGDDRRTGHQPARKPDTREHGR